MVTFKSLKRVSKWKFWGKKKGTWAGSSRRVCWGPEETLHAWTRGGPWLQPLGVCRTWLTLVTGCFSFKEARLTLWKYKKILTCTGEQGQWWLQATSKIAQLTASFSRSPTLVCKSSNSVNFQLSCNTRRLSGQVFMFRLKVGFGQVTEI